MNILFSLCSKHETSSLVDLLWEQPLDLSLWHKRETKNLSSLFVLYWIPSDFIGILSVFRKVVHLKFNYKIRFLDVGSVLQPVLYEVCLWYTAHIMLSCWAGRGCLEIQEEVQAHLYIFIFVWAFVHISHSISNASFGFSPFEVEETHQSVWFQHIWNSIGIFVC